MAVMEKMRRNVFGVIGTIFLFIILIVMVWGDASQGGGGGINPEQNIAGTVNGEGITYAEFSALTELYTQYERQIQGKTEIDNDQMQEQAWNFLEVEQLLVQAAEEYGITVSNDQLRDHMFLFPAQRLQAITRDSTGNFNQALYQQFLSNPDALLGGSPPEQIAFFKSVIQLSEREARLQIIQSQLSDLVGSIYPYSPTLLRSQYDLKNAKASGSFVLLNANLVPDGSVEVTDEEAKAYYDEHLPLYKREPSRVIRYVTLRLGPSEKDSSKVQKKFQKYIAAMEGAITPAQQDSVFSVLAANEFTTQKFTGVGFVHVKELPADIKDTIMKLTAPAVIGPIRTGGKLYYMNLMETTETEAKNNVRAQHILLRSPQPNDSINAIAEDLAKQARDGANFETLAREHSEDSVSAVEGGDVGWIMDTTQFVPQFKDAALKASKGDIVGPVLTQFGYHIIKITDQDRRGYKLRAFNFDVNVSGATRSKLARQASQIRQSLEDGENFDSIAAKNGMRVQESPPITTPNNQIANSWKLAAFAFNGDLNDISDVITTDDDARIVAQISNITPAGSAPFDEVKEQIVATLKNKKKVEMLKVQAEKVRSGLSAGDDLATATTIDSTASIREFTDVTPTGTFPDVGQDPALAAQVFAMKPGELSNAIKGERGYYIIKLDSLSTPTDATFQAAKSEFVKQTMTEQQTNLFNRWYYDMREKSTIIRNWSK